MPQPATRRGEAVPSLPGPMRLTDRRYRAGVAAGASTIHRGAGAGATRGRAAFGADRHEGLAAAARPSGRRPVGGSFAKTLTLLALRSAGKKIFEPGPMPCYQLIAKTLSPVCKGAKSRAQPIDPQFR